MYLKKGDMHQVRMPSIAFKQYFYKLKAYSGLIYGLILIQVLALLFSMGGAGGMSASGSSELSVSVTIYSANIAMFFSSIWILITSITLTTKQYKRLDAILVSNRTTENLSNIAFLATASAFAGISSTLIGLALRVEMYFTADKAQIIRDGFFVPYSDLLIGMIAAILYLLLISAAGYIFGILIQINIIFAPLVPALIIGLLRLSPDLVKMVYHFFVSEFSLSLFVVKVILALALLFGLSILFSSRMEVSQ